VARKRVLADMAWSLATTGTAVFPDGNKLTLDPADWWQVVKFIYQHIDGPAPSNIDLTTKGNAIDWMAFIHAADDNPNTLPDS
jgi:hypothetical protein